MDAGRRAVGLLVLVAQQHLVRPERDCLVQAGRAPAFGKRRGRNLRGALGRRLEHLGARLRHPRVVGPPGARLLVEEVVLVHQLRKHVPDAPGVEGVGLRLFGIHEVVERFPQQRVGVLRAQDVQQPPGAIDHVDAMDLGTVMEGGLHLVERLGKK